MAQVIITERLKEEIEKMFKGESVKIFELMLSLGNSPHKGKFIGQVGGIVVKEIRYGGCFRFYFITDGYKLKVLGQEELKGLLIKFVRMSDKKDQQKVIDEIKYVLRNFGEGNFQ
jgi:hypothetical protein